MGSYTCTVLFFDAAGTRMNLPFPLQYSTGRGWKRVIPEEGTPVLVTFRPGNIAEISKYYDNASPTNLQLYDQGKSLYRTLVPGEFDDMTPGHAGRWSTILGRDITHGGPVLSELERAYLWNRQEGGVIELTTPQADDYCKARIGTVIREIAGEPTIITRDGTPPAQGGEELREFSVEVGRDPVSSTGEEGTKLAEVRAGSVVEPDGTIANHQETGKPLRFRVRVHNEKNSDTADLSIDKDGSTLLKLPQTATMGFLARLLGGDFEIENLQGSFNTKTKEVQMRALENASITAEQGLYLGAGNDTSMTSGNSINLAAKNQINMYSPGNICVGAVAGVDVTTGDQLSLSGDALAQLSSSVLSVVSAPDTRIGSSAATLRVVLESFITLFNSHMHSGIKRGYEVTDPPVTPADDSVLSVNTKVF
jgi:hypothetical protein